MTCFDTTSFLGFERRTGNPGVRNHLLLLSLSGLDNAIAEAVHRLVPSAVEVRSQYGRGQIGADAAFQSRMTRALATHPNVGAAVVIGPDDKMVNAVGAALEAAGRPWAGVSLQSCHEDHYDAVAMAARHAGRLRREISGQDRSRFPVSRLAIAIECGHSDATSGIITNPLVGDLATWLVDQGGRAVFSETLEWTGTGKILAARATTPDVATAIQSAMAERHALAEAAGHDVQANNPGPQNHAGGLTTLEEKSLGAIAKGGNQPIAGLIREGMPLPDPAGLYLMDTPCLSSESITSMIASGAQVVVFTTGQGNPYGSAIAPTIKVTANPETAARLTDQIDFDASAVALGQCGRSELLGPIADCLMSTASGRLTWSEAAGEANEVISRLGPSI